jgi:hypothetical protein
VKHVPKEVTIWTDTGFQGIKKQHFNSVLPDKSTKKHPLTENQKNNRIISGIRVVYEHAITTAKQNFRFQVYCAYMVRIDLTQEEQELLRRHNKTSSLVAVRLKAQAVLMRDKQMKLRDITHVVGRSE